MAEPNWKKIKAEYIRGGTSYKKLSEKYGISQSTIRKVAAKEKWVELRNKSGTKRDMKIAESVAKKEAEKFHKILSVTDLLLDKIEEKVKAGDILIESRDFKALTAALKDIKDIKTVKTDLDIEEQKARIAKLKKDTEDDKKDNSIQIVIGNGAEDYAE